MKRMLACLLALACFVSLDPIEKIEAQYAEQFMAFSIDEDIAALRQEAEKLAVFNHNEEVTKASLAEKKSDDSGCSTDVRLFDANGNWFRSTIAITEFTGAVIIYNRIPKLEYSEETDFSGNGCTLSGFSWSNTQFTMTVYPSSATYTVYSSSGGSWQSCYETEPSYSQYSLTPDSTTSTNNINLKGVFELSNYVGAPISAGFSRKSTSAVHSLQESSVNTLLPQSSEPLPTSSPAGWCFNKVVGLTSFGDEGNPTLFVGPGSDIPRYVTARISTAISVGNGPNLRPSSSTEVKS